MNLARASIPRFEDWLGPREPMCPWCGTRFPRWAAAKAHVKHCSEAPHKRFAHFADVLSETDPLRRKRSAASFTRPWGGIPQKKGENMGKTIGKIKGERGIGGPPMLRGQDLPKGKKSVTVTVQELREAPSNFKSTAIIDFTPAVDERSAWAVNITNLRALARVYLHVEEGKEDEADFDEIAGACKGKKLTLDVVKVNNPQTKKLVPSLFVHE